MHELGIGTLFLIHGSWPSLQQYRVFSASTVTYLVHSSKATHSPCWKVRISSRFPHKVALSELPSLKNAHIQSKWISEQPSCTVKGELNLRRKHSIINFTINTTKFKTIIVWTTEPPLEPLDDKFCPEMIGALTCHWLARVVENSPALSVILSHTRAHVPGCPVPPITETGAAE